MIYNLEQLRREVLAGKRYDFLFFWGHTPSPGGGVNESCLSQWYPSLFEENGVRYTHAEQYMMAEKARLFGDEEVLERILASRDPKQMKALGRQVRRFDQTVWKEKCYGIVLQASRLKFAQDKALLEFLLGTGKRILVEASPRDRIWGIGMGRNNPDAQNPMKWRGSNLLGFALSEARDELKG